MSGSLPGGGAERCALGSFGAGPGSGNRRVQCPR